MKISPFKAWWKAATSAEKTKLARLAKTTVGQLGQLAGGHRACGAALAGRISSATIKVGPFIVLRSSLSPACARCEYARKCEKR